MVSIESVLKGWEGKPIYIKWHDCAEKHGWSTKAEAEAFCKDNMDIDSCGYFYRIEDDRVLISLSKGYADDSGSPSVFGSLVSIPRSAIISAKRLK